ncbi:A/G-specific adenine glycosylase [Mariprofundus erugo]|uniref:A/G-specific adenine glycosylase n=1 Tax=Mariprofundus erugo TaxID=2528639 RepID=UPI001EE82BB9|nr:A/G-specific adenine glycosylase [Mariprofundus erugo]
MSSIRCEALVAWYAQHARDLPWRHTADPYHIWVSEIMLQQTQVKTVLPRYLQWFEVFPDVAALAAAPLDQVLKAWEGLGYYRRARFLHQAATDVVERFGSRFPQEFAAMMSLPGIGRSTAGAIASFCYGMRTPVLDGNVKRVLRRWHGQPEATDRLLWEQAQQAIDLAGDPAIWNQAMMELGATVCTPTSPACQSCPVARYCLSADQPMDAVIVKKRAVRDLHWRIDLYICPDRGIWMTQRGEQEIWAGLWTPPIRELASEPAVAPCLVHLLTHRRLHLYGERQTGNPITAGQWVRDISQLALPTGILRLLARYGVQP